LQYAIRRLAIKVITAEKTEWNIRRIKEKNIFTMKNVIKLLVIAASVVCYSCGKELPTFTEIVIDNSAPEDVWMKSIGDVNGDEFVDLLAGGRRSGGIVAYLGPEWEKMIIKDTLPIETDAEVCDVNNDAIADIMVVFHQALAWLEGPDWTLHHIDSLRGHDVEVGDIDGDGLIDLVMRNQGEFGPAGGHTLYIYKQTENRDWTKYQREIPDGEGLKLADINRDDRDDIVTNGHWYENTGMADRWLEHTFTNTWTWPNTYIDVADINNDGRNDILHSPSELAGTYYHISWFEAPEDPTSVWQEHIIADSIESVVHSIGAGDFNLDGRIDVVTAEMQQGEDPDEVAVYYNLGRDRWDKQVISEGGCHSMRVVDSDGDGDPDIYGANFAENVTRIWVNGLK
jgi:hypothetical protein